MSQPAPEFQIIVALLTAVNEQQEQIARLSEQVSKLEAENKELSDRRTHPLLVPMRQACGWLVRYGGCTA